MCPWEDFLMCPTMTKASSQNWFWYRRVFGVYFLHRNIFYQIANPRNDEMWPTNHSETILIWKRNDKIIRTTLAFFFWPHHLACGILGPWPGNEPGTPQSKHHILTTRQPRNSWHIYFWVLYLYDTGWIVLSRKQVIFLKSTLMQEFLSGTNVSFILTSLSFS